MQVRDGHGYGLWLGANDPKSREYTYTHRVLKPTLSAVVHKADGPITDQGKVGACGGFTDTDTMNCAKFVRSRRRAMKSSRYLTNPTGLSFYKAATLVDEWPDQQYPPDDTGTSVLACAKVLKNEGFIDRYEWAWDMEGFLAALTRQPVMLGTLWTSGMDDPDRKGLIRPTGELVGGHAYMAYGVYFTTRKVKFRNHWTRDWGVDGDFFMGFDDVEWLIEQQGEVLVPIPV